MMAAYTSKGILMTDAFAQGIGCLRTTLDGNHGDVGATLIGIRGLKRT